MVSCVGRKYLTENQQILFEQNIEGADQLNSEDLNNQLSYKPNDRILFFPWSPYVGLYQTGLKKYDSVKYNNKISKVRSKFEKKIAAKEGKEKKQKKLREKQTKKENKQYKNIKEGNLFMRLGEPLAVYDTVKEKLTTDNLRSYLHSKGYFHATVDQRAENNFKLMTSSYIIDKKEPYRFDSIYYDINDSTILKLLTSSRSSSFIKKGDLYDQENLTQERERIYEYLLNHGHFTFERKYVRFLIDTTSLGSKMITAGIQISNPENSTHKVYSIDSVIFITDADIKNNLDNRDYNIRSNITFQFYERKYIERILAWRTFLRQNDDYSRKNTFETQRQLSNMDMFKFINIEYDTTGGEFITKIITSPLQKYQTSTEAGFKVTQGLPGPFFNASIKNRNTFRGLEILELSGNVGLEGLTGASDTDRPYSSLDYGINLSLTFPQFIAPLSLKAKSRFGRLNPKTKLSFGLNFINRPEYQRNAISSSLLYSWVNYQKNVIHNFSLVDINLVQSDLTASYEMFLLGLRDQGNNLINSFNSALVTSIWYSAIYNNNDYGNKERSSSYFRYKVETGGNSERIYKEVAASRAVEVYQFAKVNFDYRHSMPFHSRATLAYRVNVGVAVPYGDNETLPYEKFYFAGGSNSIRAWEPRRLGPGSFLPIDSVTENYNNRFEQPGEILIETSIELRHKLFSILQGALFIDAGNTWTLKDNSSRPGGQFKFQNFYKEFAVGAGYGVRFDLTFLILRLDAAWKIIDPGVNSPIGRDRRRLFEAPNYPGYSRLVWNLGIGYPF